MIYGIQYFFPKIKGTDLVKIRIKILGFGHHVKHAIMWTPTTI